MTYQPRRLASIEGLSAGRALIEIGATGSDLWEYETRYDAMVAALRIALAADLPPAVAIATAKALTTDAPR